MEATLPTQPNIHEFELEIETKSGEKREYKYKFNGGDEKTKVELRATDGHKSKSRGEDALRECKRLMDRLGPLREISPDETVERACSCLEMREEQIRKLEVEIKYGDGTEVEVEITVR
jgi:hypothetical protein